MGVLGEKPRRLGGGQLRCLHCGLLQDRVATLEQEWVLLEPDMSPLAHTVPAEHRWIELSDGRVTVYGVCPPRTRSSGAVSSTGSPARNSLCRICGGG
ncbi:DUF6083 domain-containing protein [Streptomyces nigra]|uniref:DUF6083 domain-containing protein n=1 Tax=Streptomyces nigra TaxID=1827580 RepID=UPI0036761072